MEAAEATAATAATKSVPTAQAETADAEEQEQAAWQMEGAEETAPVGTAATVAPLSHWALVEQGEAEGPEIRQVRPASRALP